MLTWYSGLVTSYGDINNILQISLASRHIRAP